jgi:hypothetical protein
VSKWDKLLERILAGRSDANISFDDLCMLLGRLGYTEDITASHHIFQIAGQREIINIQPQKDGKVKAYQVRQIRAIFQKYGITQLP